ncbi:protein HIDE1 isoform X1 [Arvicola amphibius]|uniref:protein HIDE1 isoform X1 n=1 Tax=Arvicola amphibius TaxID=1047088 RepID=UPI0018E31260|nr:protein HIDE1 isoform X1 [Arvicola amphibius]
MGREMPWTILLFASGSLAIPAPSIFLVPPYPSSQDDPIYISCTAPEGFLGANFTLFRGEEAVQLLQAPSDQPGVTFNVTGGGSENAGGNFRCQYGVMGEHSQPQLSDLSQSVQVSFPAPIWIMTLSLSLAGAVLLLTGLVVVTVVVRKAKIKNLQKQRERESCWAQINFTNTGAFACWPPPLLHSEICVLPLNVHNSPWGGWKGAREDTGRGLTGTDGCRAVGLTSADPAFCFRYVL